MLTKHIDTKVESGDVTQTPNRNGYGEGLRIAGERDPQVVALSADLTESTRTNIFAEAYPDRFVQVGIAEQNMASVASGMAAMGKVPFIASYAMFSPGRSWEQIRTTIAYNDTNVKIIGAHSGISVGPDGATHQAVEDMAIMRVIPNMVVIAPCDAIEARKATLAIAKYEGPVYMRIAREKTPDVTTEASPFTIGKAELFYTKNPVHQKTVGIVVTGTLAYTALEVAKRFENEGVGVSVLHMATIKPLDEEALRQLGKEHDIIVTLEEHQIAGGLGGAVAEYYSSTQPKHVCRIGIDDTFGQSGTPEELLRVYGLDCDAVYTRIHSLLESSYEAS